MVECLANTTAPHHITEVVLEEGSLTTQGPETDIKTCLTEPTCHIALDDPIFTTEALRQENEDQSSDYDSADESLEEIGASEDLSQQVRNPGRRGNDDESDPLATDSDIDEDLVHPRRHYARLKAIHATVITNSAVLRRMEYPIRQVDTPESRNDLYVQECRSLLTCIDGNLQFLRDRKFCSSTINFLRADPTRQNVAILTCLDTSSIFEISSTLKDVEAQPSSFLATLNRKCKLVFKNWFPFSAVAATTADCYAYGILQLLDLIICCYSGSHVAPLRIEKNNGSPMRFVHGRGFPEEILEIGHRLSSSKWGTKFVVLKKRRLKCVDGFLGSQTVWVFHDEGHVFPTYSETVPGLLTARASPYAMFLLARPEDFRDIWGPMWQIVDSKSSRLSVLRYDLENGSIIPGLRPQPATNLTPPISAQSETVHRTFVRYKPQEPMFWDMSPEISGFLRHDEQFCHWVSAEELRNLKATNQLKESMRTDKPFLLIGGSLGVTLKLQENDTCYCSAAQITKDFGDNSRRRAGGTSKKRRVVDSESVNASFGNGGFGFGIGGNVTSKLLDAKLAKEILQKRWVHDKNGRNADALRRLDGIRVSFCTQHSERVSLVELFATDTMLGMEKVFCPVKDPKGRESVLKALRREPQSLIALYNDPISRESTGEFVSECISILFGTGTSRDSRNTLVAFWMHGNIDYLVELSCVWSKMVEDSLEASAFVVLEEKCLTYHNARGCQNPSRTGKHVPQSSPRLPSFFLTSLDVNLSLMKSPKSQPSLRLIKRRSGRYIWGVKGLKKGDSFRVPGSSLKVHSVISKRQIAVIWDEKIEFLGQGHLKDAWAKVFNNDPAKYHCEYTSISEFDIYAPIYLAVLD